MKHDNKNISSNEFINKYYSVSFGYDTTEMNYIKLITTKSMRSFPLKYISI